MQRLKVSIVREGTPAAPVSGPTDICPMVCDYLQGADREHFVVIHMDCRNRPTDIETVSIGSLSNSIVHPREVFKGAVCKSSAALILAHNHPSGDTTPSREDIEVTKRLADAGRILGIEVIDHVIVADDGQFLSFKERGLI
jgi:DNA repair protein RadC